MIDVAITNPDKRDWIVVTLRADGEQGIALKALHDLVGDEGVALILRAELLLTEAEDAAGTDDDASLDALIRHHYALDAVSDAVAARMHVAGTLAWLASRNG